MLQGSNTLNIDERVAVLEIEVKLLKEYSKEQLESLGEILDRYLQATELKYGKIESQIENLSKIVAKIVYILSAVALMVIASQIGGFGALKLLITGLA